MGYRISHAGVDIAKDPVGFSQPDAAGVIDLSGEHLCPAEAAFVRPTQSRNYHARPLQRYHPDLFSLISACFYLQPHCFLRAKKIINL